MLRRKFLSLVVGAPIAARIIGADSEQTPYKKVMSQHVEPLTGSGTAVYGMLGIAAERIESGTTGSMWINGCMYRVIPHRSCDIGDVVPVYTSQKILRKTQ